MPCASTDLGPIEPQVSYPLEIFQGRVGLGRHGMRAARNAGLRVRYLHGRGYVIGSDWLRYVEEHGRDTAAAS